MAQTKRTSSKKKAQKDIFSTIKADHRLVESIFEKIEKSKAAGRRETLYSELRTELTKHAEAEEKALYPHLIEEKRTRDLGLEAVEEHDMMKHLFSKIDGLGFDDERWMATVSVLKEIVSHHVKEEESELFAKIRKNFSKEERQQILSDFQASKEGGPIENLREGFKQMVA